MEWRPRAHPPRPPSARIGRERELGHRYRWGSCPRRDPGRTGCESWSHPGSWSISDKNISHMCQTWEIDEWLMVAGFVLRNVVQEWFKFILITLKWATSHNIKVFVQFTYSTWLWLGEVRRSRLSNNKAVTLYSLSPIHSAEIENFKELFTNMI